MTSDVFHRRAASPSRRRFVAGLAAGGVAAGSGLWHLPAVASAGLATSPQTLTGTQFDLAIDAAPVNFTGRTRERLAARAGAALA
jgi:FtsP/CotA-like multicopper oxidase with cupredoxin domain